MEDDGPVAVVLLETEVVVEVDKYVDEEPVEDEIVEGGLVEVAISKDRVVEGPLVVDGVEVVELDEDA